MNRGNTKITGITVTTGGSGFTSAPILEFSGTGHAKAAVTFTDGVITGIILPVLSGNKLFTGIPAVSVAGGGLPTASITLNPHTHTLTSFIIMNIIKAG